jgi:hypothetical protein
MSNLSLASPQPAPTMMDLICFPMSDGNKVDLTEEIASYKKFGILLLEDKDGGSVKAIEKEHSRNASDINHDIFQKWIQGKGKPVTWATLVDVLENVGLVELAKNIKDVKCCDTH